MIAKRLKTNWYLSTNASEQIDVLEHNKTYNEHRRIATVKPFIYHKTTRFENKQIANLLAACPALFNTILDEIKFLETLLKINPKTEDFLTLNNTLKYRIKTLTEQISKI